MVMDGFGYSLLVRRTAEVYSRARPGRGTRAAHLRTARRPGRQDAGYRASADFAADRAHWSGAFADRPQAPQLAGRGALPSRTFRRRTAHLPPETTEGIRELAARLRATWPDVLIAAQALYTSRATDRSDVVLGLPMMGRMGSAALRVPGMVMNVLPLRLTVSPDATFAELVRQVVLGIRQARRHQRYRYEDIRRDLGLLGEGRALVGPLVNIMPFDYGVEFAGAPARARNLSAGPVDDLTVNVYDRADGRGLRIDHDGNPALYEDAELAGHQERFLHLLDRLAAADPQRAARPPTASPRPPNTPWSWTSSTRRSGRCRRRPSSAPSRRAPPAPPPRPRWSTATPRSATRSSTPAPTGWPGTSRLSAPGPARWWRSRCRARWSWSSPCWRCSRPVRRICRSTRTIRRSASPYMLDDAAPVCAVTDRPGRLPDGTGTPLLALDGLDLRAYSGDRPGAPADARAPRLRHLHLRFHGPPQGCGGLARGDRQPAAVDAGTSTG